MPFEPVILGFKFDVKLRQLTGRDVLRVTCPACHKVYSVPPYLLYERYHEYLPIEAISKDFRCKRCGNNKDMKWCIERATGPEYPRSA